MELTTQQVLTYIDCPIKYALTYNARIKPDTESLHELWSKAMHTAAYYFWYRLMDAKRVTEQEMLDKWESLWYKALGITREDIIFSRRDERVDLGLKGTSILQGFMRNISATPSVPICIAKEFSVPIGDHVISGNFEVVRETKEPGKRLIEIIDYKTGQTIPDQTMVDMDLALSIQSYAFRHMFQAKEQRLTYYYMRHNRSINTVRESLHYRRMIETIKAVADSIQSNIYYPRQTFMCKSCTYKQYCDVWPT